LSSSFESFTREGEFFQTVSGKIQEKEYRGREAAPGQDRQGKKPASGRRSFSEPSTKAIAQILGSTLVLILNKAEKCSIRPDF
jgi:hypothetical protein